MAHRRAARDRSTALRALLAAAAALASLMHAPAACAQETRILVFTRTAASRHDSIEPGVRAIRELCDESSIVADHTEDPSAFTPANLARYAAVVFLNTSGNVLGTEQEHAFEGYIRGGGGFVGVHAAADTEYDWAWYQGLVGAAFRRHPGTQRATVKVLDRAHPSTRHLPARWTRTDEWYAFRANPRTRPSHPVHVLASLDEATYEPRDASMGWDHPVAWCHEYDGGRAWYTAGGHDAAAYLEPEFRAHLLGGVRWAAGLTSGEVGDDAGATRWDFYDRVVLDDDVRDPMELDVLPDGRVLFIERGGTIKIHKPDERTTVVAGFIPVSTAIEDGLLGLAIDPDFARTGWIYVYFSPLATATYRAEKQVLARLTLEGDHVRPNSGVWIMEVATQRRECCHSGGSLAFGPDGCLYISTGDNVNPFESSGYAPIDERPGRSPFDAQGTSADTNDLRGKILRIRPMPDGTYTIPEGNLFPYAMPDGTVVEGRPEIYVMGCRNPFRIAIDPRTGWLYWGDVGPDAPVENASRGPAGRDEWNQAREAGNFGWPYTIGPNLAYRDWDFQAELPGEFFIPEAPVNDSPNNTGSLRLPPARPAWISYLYAPTPEWPQLGTGGRCAMAGPIYHAPARGAAPRALADYFENSLFVYEWTRNVIMEVKLDDEGMPLAMLPFMPGLEMRRPHDLELGPDGCLYLIEWGTAFEGGSDDARISRIEYHRGGRRPPVARAGAEPESGPLPLEVRFSSKGSAARTPGADLELEWDFDGDGTPDARGEGASWTYRTPGAHEAVLTARDSLGQEARARVGVIAGNTVPRVEFAWPPEGGIITPGELVEFLLRVTDAEDERIATSRLIVGQENPAPMAGGAVVDPITTLRGRVRVRDDLGPPSRSRPTLVATYTDGGAGGAPALSGRARVALRPRVLRAEDCDINQGCVVERTSDEGGGSALAFIEAGDHAGFRGVNLHGIESVAVRVASATEGGTVELRAGSPAGPRIASVRVDNTRGWQNWRTLEAPIVDPGGTNDLYLVFSGGQGFLMNVNWIEFRGPGAARMPPDLASDAGPGGPGPEDPESSASLKE